MAVERAAKAKDVDDYLSRHPAEVRTRMVRVREAIHAAVPGAGEKISYDIPTLTLDGRSLMYFAAFAKHLSVYPAPRGNPDFAEELAAYPGGKGTVRIAHDAPLPIDLIQRIARFHADRIRATRKPR